MVCRLYGETVSIPKISSPHTWDIYDTENRGSAWTFIEQHLIKKLPFLLFSFEFVTLSFFRVRKCIIMSNSPHLKEVRWPIGLRHHVIAAFPVQVCLGSFVACHSFSLLLFLVSSQISLKQKQKSQEKILNPFHINSRTQSTYSSFQI